MITTWYLQSHRTWDRFCHSCIGSPSCPRGPSRRGSLCLLAVRCTPDRSKLFGSHGQRPWLHNVVIGRRRSGIPNDWHPPRPVPCGRPRRLLARRMGRHMSPVLEGVRRAKEPYFNADFRGRENNQVFRGSKPRFLGELTTSALESLIDYPA